MKNNIRSACTKAPSHIEELQEWFGSIIKRPLIEDRINPIAPSGDLICQEAAKFIMTSPTLKPHHRLEIYNQQFWWRLQNLLQSNFPMTLRILGYKAFNEIVVQYVMDYPPNHWSLTLLGKQLHNWTKQNYHSKDRELISCVTELDWVFCESFVADQYPFLTIDSLTVWDPEKVLTVNFYLQPHLFLVEFPSDLLIFREKLVKENPEFWSKNPLPNLSEDKTHYFVIFRNLKNNVAWKEVSQSEHLLMLQFKNGLSIQKACDWLQHPDAILCGVTIEYLQTYVQNWILLGWLTLGLG